MTASSSERLIDLSHAIEDGLITYKGLPAPIVCDFLSREESRQYYAENTEFQIGKIEMVANTGTYIWSATLVGIDSLNIDDTRDGRRPVHSTLLAAEIPVVEHLTNLSALPSTGSRFFAVPVKVKRFGTFPVRAFASFE